MQSGAEMATLMGMSVNFRVTPEILRAKSIDVTAKVNSMRQHFQEIQALIDKTKGYWVGEAGDKHRQMYYALEEEKEEILQRLGKHPVELITVAERYFNVEIKIQQMIQELPGDVC